MKKLFLLLSLMFTVLSFTSCDNSHVEFDKDQIEKINYEGHEYLIFREGVGKNKIGGMTHSGNCQCLKKDSINF